MFINFEDIDRCDVTIDVRTKEEFNRDSTMDYNIPLMTKEEHEFIWRHVYLGVGIIVCIKCFIANRIKIREQLQHCSAFGAKRLVIGCSRGRARSPIVYLYAKWLGIDAKILKGGIKSIGNNNKSIKDLFAK